VSSVLGVFLPVEAAESLLSFAKVDILCSPYHFCLAESKFLLSAGGNFAAEFETEDIVAMTLVCKKIGNFMLFRR